MKRGGRFLSISVSLTPSIAVAVVAVLIIGTLRLHLFGLVPAQVIVIWLVGTLLGWIILRFVRPNRKNAIKLYGIVVNSDAVLIQFVWSAMWLFWELITASFIEQYHLLSRIAPVLVFTADVVIFETVRRVIQIRVVHGIWLIGGRLTKVLTTYGLVQFLVRRGIVGALVTVLQIGVSIYTVVIVSTMLQNGIHAHTSDAETAQLSTFLSVIVQSLFTLLGILVAVIAILVQTLSTYSSLFLRALSRDLVFWWSICSLLLATLFGLFSLTQPLYTQLFSLWIKIFVQCTCSLIYVSWMVVRYVQVSNLIMRLADGMVGIIERGISKSPRMTNLKGVLSYSVLGVRRHNPLEGLVVNSQVTNRIIEGLEAMMVLLDRGLDDNRHDVVSSVVQSVSLVIKKYVSHRKLNIYPNDSVLEYLVTAYGMRMSKAGSVKNEKLLDVVTQSMIDLGLVCIGFSGHTVRWDTNQFSEKWMLSLEKAFLAGFQRQYTAASSLAIDGISKIGVELINSGALHSGIYMSTRLLRRIGLSLCDQKGTWPALLLQHVLGGFCSLLTAQSSFVNTKGFVTDGANVAEGMEKVFLHGMSVPDDFYDKQLLTAAVVGVGDMVGGDTYVSPFIMLLQGNVSPSVSNEDRFRLMLEWMRPLRRMTSAAIKNRAGTTAWFVDAISAILFYGVVWKHSNQDEEMPMSNVNQFIRYVFETGIDTIIENVENDHVDDEHFQALSDCCAILAFRYDGQSDEYLISLLETGVRKLCAKVRQLLASGCETYDISHVCRFIKLFGAWIYAESGQKESPVVLETRNLVSEVFAYHETSVRRKSYVSPYEQMDYPASILLETWSLSSSRYWPGEFRDQVTKQLVSHEILTSFHNFCTQN